MPTTYEQQLYLARSKATHLYNLACRERDRKGYRENLGYDSRNKLVDYINKFNLTYQDRCDILDMFSNLCNQI